MVLLACVGLALMLASLHRVISQAPRLRPPETGAALIDTQLTVVVPAYNEADNIGELVTALLASQPPCRSWSLLVVDDDSSDDTVALARQAAGAGPPASRPAPASLRTDHWRV